MASCGRRGHEYSGLESTGHQEQNAKTTRGIFLVQQFG
jgi:hypothetical protein